MAHICFLNSELNLEDIVPSQNMNVVILQTFDSLTSYEQLLLKCSSVLGDIFPRDMLLYIMSSTATRLTALGYTLFQLISDFVGPYKVDFRLFYRKVESSQSILICGFTAVQKLFEIQVLSCARGNFLDGGLTFKDRLSDPNEDLSVKCDCIGLLIDGWYDEKLT